MKRIDKETVQRILDAADIVDVVSDYVQLKKKGANYMGLCPFHADRNPSFSVSKSRNICKCFSCGKGGSPVGFIMELENMSYNEALRHLAKKYNIEIKEEQVSEEEQQADHERESMFAVNEWALTRFTHNLFETDEGRNIGLAYFLDRGLNENTIRRFKLGYALEKSDALLNEAHKSGYSDKYLLETGLCGKSDKTDKLYDRFKGRVIFPVFTVSGKVVAFGGRTLRTDKKIGKYVNSPESVIYSKSRELYGLYQAKMSITRKGYCILVEGYMDVLSMAQSGVENIVASSGTALTKEQIRFLHRFTDRVTLMYDSDAAGIKAALRGVDLLLAEGLDISIVLLPDGDDPDSFAQSHSSSEVEDYLRQHSEDFIKFKTRILLGETRDNPLERSRAITDIIQSIAVIPDEIKRAVYCRECSRALEIEEDILRRHVSTARIKKIERDVTEAKREEARKSIKELEAHQSSPASAFGTNVSDLQLKQTTDKDGRQKNLSRCEREILKYVVRYGFMQLCTAIDENGNNFPMNVVEFLDNDMQIDEMFFVNEVNKRLFAEAVAELPNWEADLINEKKIASEEKNENYKAGIEEIKATAIDLNDINRKEVELADRLNNAYDARIEEFTCHYIENRLLSSADDEVRQLATELALEKHQLSRYHTRFYPMQKEVDKLQELVSMALNAWKFELLESKIGSLLDEIELAASQNDMGTVVELMKKKRDLDKEKGDFAKILGERVFGPPR